MCIFGDVDRKSFIKKAGLGLAAGSTLVAGCTASDEVAQPASPKVVSGKTYSWKMVTTWPPNFPVVGEVAVHFSDWVRTMSNGRLDIQVYGGGELIPALEVFEAVSSGSAEMGSGASYYWTGRDASLPLFTTIPFGMNAQQMNAWLYAGGGLELWESIYADYNLVPRPAGNTGVQMAGWYNRSIDSMDDFKGLKMRIPGLGAKVLELAGGTPVLSAGSEIYTNLERGVIDATEWIGPYHDYTMGFHQIAKYYYAPGWHEPGSNLELMINKRDYDSLPADLQVIIDTAAYRANMWVLSTFESKNNEYLQKIKAASNVEVRQFSTDVMDGMRGHTRTMIDELISSDKKAARVYASYEAFATSIGQWSAISEKPYHQLISKS